MPPAADETQLLGILPALGVTPVWAAAMPAGCGGISLGFEFAFPQQLMMLNTFSCPMCHPYLSVMKRLLMPFAHFLTGLFFTVGFCEFSLF